MWELTELIVRNGKHSIIANDGRELHIGASLALTRIKTALMPFRSYP